MRRSTWLAAVALVGLSACADRSSKPAPHADAAVATAPEQDESDMLKIGDTAPLFEAKDEKGSDIRLADFAGKKNVVLVFYPGDDTPVCTEQLCSIRDDWESFKEKDIAVIGVNPAKAASKQGFSSKHGFPFPLIPDTDRKLVKAYGCSGLLFTKRTVYGIGKDGRIVFAKRGKPDDAEILAAF